MKESVRGDDIFIVVDPGNYSVTVSYTHLEVYVKDIDTENHKVSLGYKKAEDNPWEPVSYTHLDVYKRQALLRALWAASDTLLLDEPFTEIGRASCRERV